MKTGRTLIVPCAGRSSRFPGMRPKWLLTHPDGQLMAQKAIEGCGPNRFDKILFAILKEHDDAFEASTILSQALKAFSDKLEIIVLDKPQGGQADTVYQAIQKAKIDGAILIKDSDNYLAWDDADDVSNFVVTAHLQKWPNVAHVAAKSYVRVDENGIIFDIVEKKVVSETFCAGGYQFASASGFSKAFEEMSAHGAFGKEAFISHVIAWMIAKHDAVFKAYQATAYEDWGTLKEWRATHLRYTSFFCDIDGVLIKNVGQYGTKNWANSMEPLEGNIEAIKKLQANGGQLIFFTAREATCREALLKFFENKGIVPHALVTGCTHARRVIINDFAPTNPYPSCAALSLPRDGDLEPFLQEYLA